MAGLYPELEFHAERRYFEYVYLASDLAELPGKGYLTIRHQLNKFKKTCLPQIEKIDEGNIAEISEFLDEVVRMEGLRIGSLRLPAKRRR